MGEGKLQSSADPPLNWGQIAVGHRLGWSDPLTDGLGFKGCNNYECLIAL